MVSWDCEQSTLQCAKRRAEWSYGGTLIEVVLVISLVALLATPVVYQLSLTNGKVFCAARPDSPDVKWSSISYNPNDPNQPCRFMVNESSNTGW